MLRKNGNIVAEYAYDVWGKPISATATSETHAEAMTANPIRYRGYSYDTETGMYYVSSRYYDPEIGRFINADVTTYLGSNEDLIAFNLYVYCSNNPVIYSDPTGNFAISITMIGLIIGAIVGATIGGVVAYNVAEENGAEGSELFGWTMAGVFEGAVIGGAIGAGIGALITQLTGTLGFSFVGRQVFKVTETVVLGHYGYTTLGDSLGYSYYQIPTALYNSMTDLQRWTMNSQFLNDCGKLGANFIVEATRVLAPLCTSNCGSYLYHEIEYLLSQGYQWLEDLSALVR